MSVVRCREGAGAGSKARLCCRGTVDCRELVFFEELVAAASRHARLGERKRTAKKLMHPAQSGVRFLVKANGVRAVKGALHHDPESIPYITLTHRKWLLFCHRPKPKKRTAPAIHGAEKRPRSVRNNSTPAHSPRDLKLEPTASSKPRNTLNPHPAPPIASSLQLQFLR